MSSGKHGRLFTEADVIAICNAMAVSLCHPSEAISKLDNGEIERLDGSGPVTLTFPADEPLFLLRGQDKAAPAAIQQNPSPGRDYWMAAARAGVTNEFLAEVVWAAGRMREWQRAHPDRVKVPD